MIQDAVRSPYALPLPAGSGTAPSRSPATDAADAPDHTTIDWRVAAATSALALTALAGAPAAAQEMKVEAPPVTVAAPVRRSPVSMNPAAQPIQKGMYRLVLDYTNPAANRLYVLDTRDGQVVTRYVSNGGRAEHPTSAHHTEVRSVAVRPTWTPTAVERADQGTLLNFFTPTGPGPGGAMGVLKLRINGNEYIHGTWDAMYVAGMGAPQAEMALRMLQAGGTPGADQVTIREAPGGVLVDLGRLPLLGTPISYGCWNMSNPNVVELRERFGVGSHSRVDVLRASSPQDRQESLRLQRRFASAGLADRPLSAGLEYLDRDYAGPQHYLHHAPYQDASGRPQPDDGWYLQLWHQRAAQGL